MKRLDRPRYWQLDVLLAALVVLAVALMRAHLSPGWALGAEIGWSLLTLLGLGLWICGDYAGSQHEERTRRGRPAPQLAAEPMARTRRSALRTEHRS